MAQAADQATAIGEPSARRTTLGYLSYVLGCILAVAAGGALVGVLFFPGDDFLVLLLIFFGLIAASVTLLVVAEGFLVPSCADVCERDPRPPVLFLRPFDEDKERTYDVISSGETTTTITAKAEDFLTALNAVGPLISIGRPSMASRLGIYPHGAFRDYVPDDQWQARVRQLLDQSGMVVLSVGDSPGIEWEIDQVRGSMGPESLLLYLPPRPVDALTRKGRAKKESAVYEHFKVLIERYFDIELPPYSEALYIIGFDASGSPVMAPDAPRSRWTFTEYGRIARSVTAQLKGVLHRLRPEVDLKSYRVPGRAAMWWRISVATLSFLGALGLSLSMSSDGPPGAFAHDLISLFVPSLPGLVLIVGWVLLARHFGRRWVWSIPILLGLVLVINLGFTGARIWGWWPVLDPITLTWFNALNLMLDLAYATAVVALGLVASRYRYPPPRR